VSTDAIVCEDKRPYVGWHGQQWTTMAEIARGHTVILRNEETDLVAIGVEPSFAIGQRALLVRTPHGNVLWDCISLLDEPVRGPSPTRRSVRRNRASRR
jgi:hypothetical protein